MATLRKGPEGIDLPQGKVLWSGGSKGTHLAREEAGDQVSGTSEVKRTKQKGRLGGSAASASVDTNTKIELTQAR